MSKIQHKRSNVAGKVPQPADLEIGQFAINFADQVIYSKDPGNQIVEIGRALPALPTNQEPSLLGVDGSGTIVWEPVAYNPTGAADTGKIPVLGVGGTLDLAFMPSGVKPLPADAGGVLINDGSGNMAWRPTITGGNGVPADAGKVVVLDANGKISQTELPLPADTGDASVLANDGAGQLSWLTTHDGSTLSTAANAGEVPVLDSTGKLQSTILNIPSVMTFRGGQDPANALPANPAIGDYYIILADGTIGSTAASKGDSMVWDGAKWDVFASSVDLAAYLLLDGSVPMIGDFNAGNNQIINLKNAVKNTDAATFGQLNNAVATLTTTINGVLPADAAGLLTNDGSGTLSWEAHRTDAQNDARYARTTHNHNASNINAGTLDIARIPTGTTATTVALGNHTHANMVTHTGNLTANHVVTAAAAGAISNTAATITTAGTLTIPAGQRLGVGVTPAQPLHVSGIIAGTSDIIAYYSDMRLKDVQGPIDDALWKVSQLDAFYYKPNDKALSLNATSDESVQVGVSAQQVEKVLPEIVRRAPFDMGENDTSLSGEDYKTVQYEKLVPLLIAAINELREIVESK